MVRESEVGWLFYRPDGQACSVTAAEAEAIERALVRRLDRYMRDLAQLERRVFAAALCAGFALWLAQSLPPISPVALPVVGPALLAYVGWEGMSGLRYHIAQRRWRRTEAAKFAHRMPVDGAVEARHRRYNLFGFLSDALILGGVARAIWFVFTHADMSQVLDPVAIMLLGLGWLLKWPAGRVDTTHRRRRRLA